MLHAGEVSYVIRLKCGLSKTGERNENTFFSKEEQIVIMAHLAKQEELLKQVDLADELVKSITKKVMDNLNLKIEEGVITANEQR